MANIDEKEIQKTLEEMKRRAEEFQTGKMYTPETSFSSVNLKLILAIVGVIIVLIASIFFYVKSGSQKAEIKAPPGQIIIYPKDGPPRLAPKL